jgi:hypothetical protein
MEARQPTPLDDFLFDLNGYLILKNAVEPELVDELNAAIDSLPPLEYGEWYGNTERRDYTSSTGLELHNCVELGGPFEKLIDHPGWIDYVRHYCGEEKSYVAGLFIDECILSVRELGATTRSIPAAFKERCVGRIIIRMASSAVGSVTSFWP